MWFCGEAYRLVLNSENHRKMAAQMKMERGVAKCVKVAVKRARGQRHKDFVRQAKRATFR